MILEHSKEERKTKGKKKKKKEKKRTGKRKEAPKTLRGKKNQGKNLPDDGNHKNP